jgi:hypothetical protein
MATFSVNSKATLTVQHIAHRYNLYNRHNASVGSMNCRPMNMTSEEAHLTHQDSAAVITRCVNCTTAMLSLLNTGITVCCVSLSLGLSSTYVVLVRQ